ncbi:flavodoxin family protein [Leptospira kanakyensis]|uniref:Flavodoxin family protein n=1 Tax=Leptospira kanakyensis TaxID=2484968 RepID=A0A6N4Q527_9LEPT|nr:NAD(P)H-dependent oxidoreductase [Leptospira kanakyensis]TGK50542.1 flavodoxin family protein [Leptospira kanakyensis]TGK63857.1 flavodoxin family protein [Leptospira kanakyensis]TGK69680.1 flavodoxin family protein [Leptospira kanakyensis]
MKNLIIYSHSNPKSFTKAVLDSILNSLIEKSEIVSLIDLYSDKFNPVLVVDDYNRRRDICNDKYTLKYRNLINEADHLIFIYPVWWHGFPAILKGFIDRVFASDFIYSFKNKKKGALFPEGLMKNKKISCFYTLDAPSIVAYFDPGWLAIKYGLFRYCGFKRVNRYYKSGLKHCDQEQKNQWLLKCAEISKNFR